MTEYKYERAISILGSLELDRIIQDFGSTSKSDTERSSRSFVVTEILERPS